MLAQLLKRAVAFFARREPSGGGISQTLGTDFRLAGRTLSRTLRAEIQPDDAARRAYLGSLAAVCALLEPQKERLRRDVLGSDLYRRSGWTEIGGTLGKGWVTQGAAVLLYGGGLLAGLPRAREAGLLVAESYAAAQTTAAISNFVVSERRPWKGGRIRYFHRGGSTVSLHMINTIALARVLDRRLTRLDPRDSTAERMAKVLGKVALWSLPTITAWQRMRSDEHYLWNVVLGAGQSFYVTGAVLRAHDAETRATDEGPGNFRNPSEATSHG